MNQKANIMRNEAQLVSIALEMCHNNAKSAEQLLQNYQMEHGYLSYQEVMYIHAQVNSTKRIWAMEEAEFKAHLNYL